MSADRRKLALSAVLLALTGAGCGGGQSPAPKQSATVPPSVAADAAARDAAIRLVLSNANTVIAPHGDDIRVMRRLMRRYYARTQVERRAREISDAIRQVGGGAPRTDAVTVSRWEETELDDDHAEVEYTGYESRSFAGKRPFVTPLRRTRVAMVREEGRWKLVELSWDWLSPDGPLGTPGDRATERVEDPMTYPNPVPPR